MPTGYTSVIREKDVTFKEFALRCARGMGALIMMRDDPMDAEIPDHQPNSIERLRKQVHALEMRISRLKHASRNKIQACMFRDMQERAKRNTEYITEAKELAFRYGTMLAEVIQWQPPTPDHEGFKKFMAEQIVQSAEHDCSTEYYQRGNQEVWQELQSMTPEEWKERKLAELQRSLDFYKKELADEKNRSHDRDEWVRQLKESLA